MDVKFEEPEKGKRLKYSLVMAILARIKFLFTFDVDGATGLQWNQSTWKLSFIPPPISCFAVITVQCPAYTTSSSTFGKGAGRLDVLSYSASGVCTRAQSNPARILDIYNGGHEVIPVGRRVKLIRDSEHWHVDVNYCPPPS